MTTAATGAQVFDLGELAARLPGDATSLVTDLRLVDRPEAGWRLFRVNRRLPRHLHRKCDEHLFVLRGRALFEMGDAPVRELAAGQAVYFPRGTWHGFPAIIEAPFLVLAFETPSRDPSDVVFAGALTEPFLTTVEPSRA